MNQQTKDTTAMQELIEYLEKYKDVIGGTSVMIIDKSKALLQKEREQIENAVNKTIDAYNFYVESPHNPPPMNGSDFFTETYKQ
jgi:hypothetical protein